MIAQAIGIIVGTAMLFSFLIRPIYKGTAKVVIYSDSFQPDFFSSGAASSNLPASLGKERSLETRNLIDTYIYLAKTPSVVGKVIRDLNMRTSKGKLIDVDDFIISLTRMPKLIVKQKRGVKIKRIHAAEMLEITGYSSDQKEAIKIANEITDSFLVFLSGLIKREASKARESIENKLNEIKDKKVRAENAEEKFRISQNIIDITNQVEKLIDELSALETDISSTQKSIEESESIIKEKRKMELNKTGEPLADKSNLVEYKNQLLEQETNLSDQLSKLTSEHPMVKSTRKQIKILKNKIEDETKRIRALDVVSYYDPLVDEYAKAKSNIVSLMTRRKVLLSQIAEKKRELNEMPKKSIELSRLTSRVNVLSDIYKTLLARLEYTKLAESMVISNVANVQRASLNFNPKNNILFPKKGLILGISTLFGIFFGLFLCFLMEYFDNKMKTSEEITDKLDQPVLGIVPKIKNNHLNGDLIFKEKLFYNKFWDIRTNMKMSSFNINHKIISITSTKKGEGKSTVAKYLAVTFAEAGQKVLVVDFNLHHPFLHQMFNMPNTKGLSNFLKGEYSILNDLILKTSIQRLHLITSGPEIVNPLKVIDSPNMQRFIEAIQNDKEYNLVIFDNASVEDGSDAAVISSHCDNQLYIIAQGKTSLKDLKNSMKTMNNNKTDKAGIVINYAS